MDLSTQSLRTVSAAAVTTAAIAIVGLVAPPALADEDRHHTVVAGDTVWALAKRNGTTVDAIIQANGLGPAAVIRIGQVLTIPGTGGTGTSTSGTTPTTASTTHTVVPGDTVWALAKRNGTTVDAIIKANNLGAAAVIRIGQVLTIPGGTAGGTSGASGATPTADAVAPQVATSTNVGSFAGTGATYVVKAGDTLSGIAARNGTTVSAIASANAIANPSLIRIGQVLTLPGATPTGLVGDTFLGRTYAPPVVAAANQNKATLNAMDVPSRTDMQAMVVRIANAYGVDPALAQAVAYQESGFNQRAVSPANAIGTMQVIPSSGQWASDIVGRDLNLLIAEDNVTAGVVILKTLLRNGTPLDTAIAGYYQGETSVRTRGMNADTVTYVANVKAHMAKFQ